MVSVLEFLDMFFGSVADPGFLRVRQPPWGECHSIIGHNFLENCMKMRKFGARGERCGSETFLCRWMFSWKRYGSTKNTSIYGKNFLYMCRHGFKYEEVKIETCIEVSFIHSLWKYPKYSFCADCNDIHSLYKVYRYSRVFHSLNA